MVHRDSTAAGLAEVLRPYAQHKSVFGICADNAANIQAISGVESLCRFVSPIIRGAALLGAKKALKSKLILPVAAKIILHVLV